MQSRLYINVGRKRGVRWADSNARENPQFTIITIHAAIHSPIFPHEFSSLCSPSLLEYADLTNLYIQFRNGVPTSVLSQLDIPHPEQVERVVYHLPERTADIIAAILHAKQFPNLTHFQLHSYYGCQGMEEEVCSSVMELIEAAPKLQEAYLLLRPANERPALTYMGMNVSLGKPRECLLSLCKLVYGRSIRLSLEINQEIDSYCAPENITFRHVYSQCNAIQQDDVEWLAWRINRLPRYKSYELPLMTMSEHLPSLLSRLTHPSLVAVLKFELEQ